MNLDWFNLERLIKSSSLSDLEADRITKRLIELDGSENEFSEHECKEIIKKIYDNQLCPIEHAMNYGQKDIIKKLRNHE